MIVPLLATPIVVLVLVHSIRRALRLRRARELWYGVLALLLEVYVVAGTYRALVPPVLPLSAEQALATYRLTQDGTSDVLELRPDGSFQRTLRVGDQEVRQTGQWGLERIGPRKAAEVVLSGYDPHCGSLGRVQRTDPEARSTLPFCDPAFPSEWAAPCGDADRPSLCFGWDRYDR